MPFTAENIYLGSGNPAFLTSTGAALYLNQQKIATESFVTGASGVLAGLISAASAGVSSLNGSSGVLNLLGAGNVTVTTAGQNITVSGNLSPFSGYVTGTFYTKNNESGFLSNLSGLSTGYVTGVSGELSSRLFNTGSNLQNQINTITAATGAFSSVKVTGGAILSLANFSGISGIVLTASGSSVLVSGDTSILATNIYVNNASGVLDTKIFATGTDLDSRIFNTGANLNTKVTSLSGYLNSNFSQVRVTGGNILTTGNFTGVGLGISVVNSGTIIFVSGDATVIASTANLQTTGINLTALTNSTGSLLDNKIGSLSGFLTGNYSTVRITGSTVLTGANFTGVGLGISVQSSGQIAFISGDATILASVQNLFTTGSTLNTLIQTSGQAVDSRINSLSGTITNNLFSTGSNLQTQINVIKSAYVTGISTSGSSYVTGGINISGIGGFVIIQSGYNTFLFSGGAGTIAAPTLTGSFIFRSGIQNGVTNQLINFPYNFSPNPRVIATLNNNISDTVIPFQVSGITATGFYAIFSAAIPDTGYSLDIMVISQDSGLSINSINNITSFSGTLLGISGSQTLIGVYTMSGVDGISVTTSGQNILISGSGAALDVKISSLSGYFNTFPKVTGISISGGVGIINAITLSGTNGISTIQSGQTILFSGANSGNLYDFTSTIGKPAYIEGRLFYDSGEKTMAYYPDTTGVTLNIGQESWIRSINVSENLISNGQAIYISGSVSGLPAINLARADSESTSQCVGMTTMDIPNNSIGYITAFGVIHGMNLSGIVPGTKMYLSQFVSGGLTGAAPSGLNFKTRVGFVTMSGATGNLLVVPSTNTRGVVVTPVASIIFDKNTGAYVPAPTTQNFSLIVDDLASRGNLALVDNINAVSYVQDAIWNKNIHNFWPNTTTTMNILGATATSAGTISHPTTFADLTGAGYTSNFITAVGGGPAGMQSNFTPFFATSGVTGIGAGFFYTAQFTFPDLSGTYCTGTPNGLKTGIGTGIRFFAGMTDAASILLTQDSPYPTAALLGFQLTRSSGTSGVFDDFFNFAVKQNGASAQMYRQNTLCPFRAQENFSAYIYTPNDFRSGIFWELNNLTQNSNFTGMFTGNYGIFLPQVNAATQTLLKPTFSFTTASGARNIKLKGMYCESL